MKNDSGQVSARFIMAILFSFTYCIIIIACTAALLMKLVTVETFVAMVAAFALVVREIVSDYFERKDRKPEGTQPEVKP